MEPEAPTTTPEKEVDVRSSLAVLASHWKLLLISVILAAIVGVLFVFFSPPVYRAQMTLLTVTDSSAASGAALSAIRLASDAPDPQMVLKGMVLSNSSLTAISEVTGVPRRQLESGLLLETYGQRAQVVISWTDSDGQLALRVIETTQETLADLQRKVAFNSARLEAENLEVAIRQKEAELTLAEAELTKFQQSLRAPIAPNDLSSIAEYTKQVQDLRLQLGAARRQLSQAERRANITADQATLPNSVPSAQIWRQRLADTEHQLRVAQITKGPMDPDVARLTEEVKETRSRLEKEVQEYLMSVRQGIDTSVASLQAQILVLEWQIAELEEIYRDAPKDAIELARLSREVQTLGEVLQRLRLQFEEARVRAEVDRVRWSVLDEPFLSDSPTNKSYVRTAGLFALAAGLLVAFTILLRDRWSRA
ncbi:MAG: GumC family protein [Fimbriimonadaceae bacterium]